MLFFISFYIQLRIAQHRLNHFFKTLVQKNINLNVFMCPQGFLTVKILRLFILLYCYVANTLSLLFRYNVESAFRKPTINRPSTEAVRDERIINEIVGESHKEEKSFSDSLSKKSFVPDTIFGKNVSPGLCKPDS